MCGIFGIYKFEQDDLNKARSSVATLNHRGPDQKGDWWNPLVFLGHRRLSILDLSENGRQPMIDDEHEVVIVVNGEIYNFQELRTQLSKDYHFKSSSDSEVLLYGYKEWGIDDLIARLDGMFAFAVFDVIKKELFLCRDRYGKKPLFYAKSGRQVLFASEIKALFEFDPALKVFSKDGIHDWMYHRGNNSRETIYYDIFQVPPGDYLKIDSSGQKLIKYYDLTDHVSNSHTYSDCFEELDFLINQAVKKRLISDVPVGLQLSGGVDSSIIANYAKNNHPGNFHSFSVGFSDLDDNSFSEEEYATFAANKMGLIHHQLNISKRDIVNEYEKVIYLTDGMLDIPNTIPIYILSRYAKRIVSVILTGEGADELFGGYTKFMQALSFSNQNKSTNQAISQIAVKLFGNVHRAKIRGLLRKLYLNSLYAGKTEKLLEDLNCYISPETLTYLFGTLKSSLFDYTLDREKLYHLPLFRQFIIEEHKSYLLALLARQDRASMGAGLEARLPFVDRSLVEWAVNLPQQFLFNEKETKIILKKLCSSMYGDEFTYRKKAGFPLPIERWLKDDNGFKPWVQNIYKNDFVLNEFIHKDKLKSYMENNNFDNKILCYGDSERMWLKWFFMVIRTTQDVFGISDIR